MDDIGRDDAGPGAAGRRPFRPAEFDGSRLKALWELKRRKDRITTVFCTAFPIFCIRNLLNTSPGTQAAPTLGGPLCSDCLNVRADRGSDRFIYSHLEHGCSDSRLSSLCQSLP